MFGKITTIDTTKLTYVHEDFTKHKFMIHSGGGLVQIKQQTITNKDQDLWYHIALLGHNELKSDPLVHHASTHCLYPGELMKKSIRQANKYVSVKEG